MVSSKSSRPLKVLSPEAQERLRAFNAAARDLQKLGGRINRFDQPGNRLVIEAEAGRRLVRQQLVSGYQRQATAASATYFAQFQGVTLEWSEPLTTQPIDRVLH